MDSHQMGHLGGLARAKKLSKKQLSVSAKKAALARWSKARKRKRRDIK